MPDRPIEYHLSRMGVEVPKLEEKDGVVQATKHDSGKPRYGLVPARALKEVAQVFTWAATDPGKYCEGNWKEGDGFAWSRLIDASDRHGQDFKIGLDFDDESGLHHLAHRICCDMMLLEHYLTNHGKDDRGVRQILEPKDD